MAGAAYLGNRGTVVYQGRVEVGAPGLVGFKVAVVDNTYHELSPWHHVPLYPPECDSILFHFVCTTPASTTLKFRPDPSQAFSPLTLLSNDGRAARFALPQPWNYGFLPQTCCLTTSKQDTSKEVPGIRNPIDTLEVGGGSDRKPGEIYAVKVLGALCFPGRGMGAEKQWTLIGIASDHWMADDLTDVTDLEDKQPGVLVAVREWAQATRQIDGKGPCTCEVVDSQAASMRVVDAHGVWNEVCSQEEDPLVDDPGRDQRLRARRRGVWSEDTYTPMTRRLSRIQKDVMFRPSISFLRQEASGHVAGDDGNMSPETREVSISEERTKLGTKADLRSPKDAEKAAGVMGRVQKRGRRMSIGSLRDWGGKEESLDSVQKVWKELESPTTNPVQTTPDGRRTGILSSVFTKWRGTRADQSVVVKR